MNFFRIIPILIGYCVMGQTTHNLTGKVLTEDQQPLAFVNVILKPSNNYSITNEKGEFKLSNISPGTYLLQVSSMGFNTLEKQLEIIDDKHLEIVLKENVEVLNEVAVEGKKNSTRQEERAITIGSFELADVVAQNNILADAVDRISGVRIRRSGSLGDRSDISINGLNGTAIRTYIDGIPMEFLYPRQDIATLPLSGIKRVDVYKGVLPVDIGTDALGGGVNIITDYTVQNRININYSVGSFNTHLGDIQGSWTNGKNQFIKINIGTNYSDNNYRFLADVLQFEEGRPEGAPPVETKGVEVERFHDAYRFNYSSLTLGTKDKPWTDHAQVIFNYQKTFREFQNNLRINNTAIGETFGKIDNFSAIVKYDKTIVEDKLVLNTVSNYSDEFTVYNDTSENVYNWLGEIIYTNRPGEFNDGNPSLTENKTKSYVNRSTLKWTLKENQKITLSNIYAKQSRNVRDFDIDDRTQYFDVPEQKINKNITGLQFNDHWMNDQLEFSSAMKIYAFTLDALSFASRREIRLKDQFYGWNVGLKWNISNSLSIRTSYEKGFLIPEIYQFGGNATGVVPNGELEPEKSKNYNFGMQWKRRFREEYFFSITANGFVRNQKDIIFLNNNINPLKYVNADDVNSIGVEGEIKIRMPKNIAWSTNLSYINKTFGDFRFASVTNNFLVGAPFPNTPSFFYNSELSWSKENFLDRNINFRMYTLFTHVNAFNFISIGKNDTETNNPQAFVPKQDRLDLGVSFSFKEDQLTTSFNIINLTDQALFDNFSIPRPGRSFNLKLIYNITNF